MLKRVVVGLLVAMAGSGSAFAQANVTFATYEGRLFILSNPTPAQCQAVGINFGADYQVTYRFTLDPATVSNSLSVGSERSRFAIFSTQSPSFSLNSYITGGPASVNMLYLGSRGNGGSTTGSATLTIDKAFNGGGAPVPTTQNVIVAGTLNDIFNVAGCTVTVRAALTRRPD